MKLNGDKSAKGAVTSCGNAMNVVCLVFAMLEAHGLIVMDYSPRRSGKGHEGKRLLFFFAFLLALLFQLRQRDFVFLRDGLPPMMTPAGHQLAL